MRVILLLLFTGYVAASAVSFFGSNHWFFDLFTHFRYQYVWAGFLLLPLFSWYKHICMAVVIAVLVGLHSFQVGSLLFSSPDSPLKPAQTVRIMMANVQYNKVDLAQTVKAINQANPEVVVILELQPTEVALLAQELTQYPVMYSQPGWGAFDITLFAKDNTLIEPTTSYGAGDIPYVEAMVQVNDVETLKLVALHPFPPVGSKTTALRNEYLTTVLRRYGLSQEPVVLIGDFNVTSFSPVFKKLVAENNWIDTQQEFGLQPSWPTWLPAFMRIPIDHALVSDKVEVYNRWLGAETGSDHLPVVIDVGVK